MNQYVREGSYSFFAVCIVFFTHMCIEMGINNAIKFKVIVKNLTGKYAVGGIWIFDQYIDDCFLNIFMCGLFSYLLILL